MAKANPAISVLTHFADLQDFRLERSRLHNLMDIIAIALCAVISGAEGWVDIEKYGRAKVDWLQTFLQLPNGIPSHDTFRRIFCFLKPEAFLACFQRWVGALTEHLKSPFVAIDGKAARRSLDRAAGKAALHLVSAWATEQRLVLGQVATEAKSNEITAIPKLLELLDVSGAMVTIDAMGCQKEIAATIRGGGGDYVLTVKENQERLYEDIVACFQKGLETDFEGLQYSYYADKCQGHGRSETRQVHTILSPEGIRDEKLWKDLNAITLVVRERQQGNQEPSLEVHYYIGSRKAKAPIYGRAIRGHWGIENGLHWVLDMSFDEDQCRMRTDHSGENFALLRRLGLSLLKQHDEKEGSIRGKRLQCGWSDSFLVQVVSGQ